MSQKNVSTTKKVSEAKSSQIDDLSTSLLSYATEGNWTLDEFKAMDRKVLGYYARWNNEASHMPDEHRMIIKSRGFTVADKMLALQVYNAQTSKLAIASKPDSHINLHGGSMHYTPEKVVYRTNTGLEKERNNSPIPAEFSETERYDNVVPLAALCGQLVEVEDAKWKSSVNMNAWTIAFERTGINISGIPIVVATIIKVLSDDRVWNTYTMSNKNSVSGLDKITFIRRALDRLAPGPYDILNTTIVCKLFKTFGRVGNDWEEILDSKGNNLVDKKCFEERPKKLVNKAIQHALLKEYPAVFWYRGGWAPMPFIDQSTSDFTGVKKNVQQARDVQGSNGAATAILAHMKDFSGLTDAFGKRIQFQLAATLFVWTKHKTADIQINTVGDIPMLISSLKYWRDWIFSHKPVQFLKVHSSAQHDLQVSSVLSVVEELPECLFRIVLPGIGSEKNIHPNHREYVSTRFTEGSTIVYYYDADLPSAREKNTPVDIDTESFNILPDELRKGHDLIVYSSIYGIHPFCNDPVARKKISTMISWKFWGLTPHVYAFGNASYFRGILSTYADLSLIGYGFQKIPTGWNRLTTSLVAVPLDKMASQALWYSRVQSDAVLLMVAWLRPVSRYSPISNLPRVSRTTANIVQMQHISEEGSENIGNIQVPVRSAVVRKIYRGQYTKAHTDGNEAPELTSQVDAVLSTSVDEMPSFTDDRIEDDEEDDDVDANLTDYGEAPVDL